jgi:hypothetical protein
MRARGLLGLAAALVTLGVAPAHAGAAAAPSVSTMIVGQGSTILTPTALTARALTRSVGGRRCRIAAATPLAALLAAGAAGRVSGIGLRDYGHCSRTRARDSSSLFVTGIAGEGNRGRSGWVYKVDRRVGTTGAADLSGPFGTGTRLTAASRLVWFWCRMGRRGCQRTLEVSPAAQTVKAGDPIRVTVTGYDDAGRGVPIAGATVRAGSSETRTDAAGVATINPGALGAFAITADKNGLVPSFPATLTLTAT